MIFLRSLPLYAVGAFFVCATIACKKEKHQKPPREEFPISYQFINEGDANVKSVIFYTTTFFPNDTVDATGDSISIINWKDQAFNEPGAYMPLDKKGYAGCTGQLKFVVHFYKPVFSPVRFKAGYDYPQGVDMKGYTTFRIYLGPVDTFTSASDNIIKFSWPSDTAHYTELLIL